MIITDPSTKNLDLGEILTQEHLYNEYIRLCAQLDSAIANLHQAGKDWALKNSLYRLAKSRAIIAIREGKNRDEREAKAGPLYEKEKLDAELAEAMKEATLEEVRGRRTQLSALQTLMASRRSELEASSYGQTGDKHGA
jgi:hypothetical protein